MVNLKKEFDVYQEKLLGNKISTMNEFKNEIIISKKFIGFQIWLNNLTADIVNSSEIVKEKKHEKEIKQFALAMNIFVLNFKRLYNTLEMIYTDSAQSNYNLFRLIFESILFSFYLSTHPNETEEILKFFNERFSEMDNPKKRKNDCTPEELIIRNRFEKYSPTKIRESLYVNAKRKSTKKIYDILSTQSHVGIETINGHHFQYSKNRVKDFFWYEKYLSFYNILAFLDNLPKIQNITNKIINGETTQILDEFKNTLSENNEISDLFPNHPNVKKSRFLS